MTGSDPTGFFIRDRDHEGAHVIEVGGEADFDAAGKIKETLGAAVSNGRRPLVLDLTEATLIDSRVIAVLAGTVGRLRAHGDVLHVV